MAAEPPAPSLSQGRDRVVEILSAHFARDDLSLEELERRLERVYQATSIAELDALTSDLGVATRAAPPAMVRERAVPAVVPEHDRIVSIMGESRRHGVWAVPQQLDVFALMSDTAIDLTQAQLPAGIIDLHVNAVMASVRIILPPGVRLANRMHVLMASAHNQVDESPPLAGAPVIRLSGWAVMADVRVAVRHREQ